MHHIVAFAPSGCFAGWPANNGLWAWENGEIVVGCSVGDFQAQPGHSVSGRIRSVLLRSQDGGGSWAADEPEDYLNDPCPLTDLVGEPDLTGGGFALRVVGTGYHGTDEPRGGFYLSEDCCRTWRGPFRLNGLAGCAPLDGLEMTPRTDYLVQGARECLLFGSARDPNVWGSDRVFCARTSDACRTFQFVSWMVPPSDAYRAVMPSTVRCSSLVMVSAVRRRDMSANQGWIDAYGSTDGGESWSYLSRIGETGGWNGNPPALVRLRDGRLCCVYGHRTHQQMIARFSPDEGHSWNATVTLRDDFCSVDGEPDLGYPRLVQRADGCLVAAYYWATRDHPRQHIAATLWFPVGSN
jgi:hypothetical protein